MSIPFLSKPPKPVFIAAPAPPAPPSPTGEDVTKAVQDQRSREKRRRGFGATILTGGQGVLGAAPTSATTLLGS